MPLTQGRASRTSLGDGMRIGVHLQALMSARCDWVWMPTIEVDPLARRPQNQRSPATGAPNAPLQSISVCSMPLQRRPEASVGLSSERMLGAALLRAVAVAEGALAILPGVGAAEELHLQIGKARRNEFWRGRRHCRIMRSWSKLTHTRSGSKRTCCRERDIAGWSVRVSKFMCGRRIHMRPDLRPRKKLLRLCRGARPIGGMGNDRSGNRHAQSRSRTRNLRTVSSSTSSSRIRAFPMTKRPTAR